MWISFRRLVWFAGAISGMMCFEGIAQAQEIKIGIPTGLSGANSVVAHDIEPYSVVAGAPAKVLRKIVYDS